MFYGPNNVLQPDLMKHAMTHTVKQTLIVIIFIYGALAHRLKVLTPGQLHRHMSAQCQPI